MNNYEKIKSMSVDEMAEFIFKSYFPCEYFNGCCSQCSQIVQDFCEQTNDYTSTNDMKQWLLAESEG